MWHTGRAWLPLRGIQRPDCSTECAAWLLRSWLHNDNKSDYLIEVEIKISISDFRADFKKKHYHDCSEVNALYYALPKELYEKHKEEVNESCDKVGAGIILISKRNFPNGHSYCYLETCAFAKKPKLRKAKPLTVYQKLKFARLGCLRWPSLWHHRNG